MAIRQRNDPVRLFWKRLAILALFGLVVAAAFGVWNSYQKERESAELRDQAQAQLSDLTSRQTQLNSDISKLQTERGTEEILREQYALAAKGENEIVIVDASSAQPVAEATSSAFVQWIHRAFPWW